MLKNIYVIKVKKFTDLEDGNREYKRGDEYPAEDAPKPSDKRIAQLASKANKARVQIIERLTVEAKEEEDAEEVTPLEDLKKDELQALLDEKEIEYNKSETKEELVKKLEE